jgi:hypothetical protein
MAKTTETTADTEEKKTPAKKKGNIENLEALAAEFLKGKMPVNKASALRKKLVQLFTEKKATTSESDLMERILRHERNLGRIASSDNYLLNQIEADRCEEYAIVQSDEAPAALHLKKGVVCRFSFDREFNDNKNKKDSVGRYFVYVPRTIPQLNQLSYADALKHSAQKDFDIDKYKERVVIHRLVLKVQEFHKWLEIQDESILDGGHEASPEDAYTF